MYFSYSPHYKHLFFFFLSTRVLLVCFCVPIKLHFFRSEKGERNVPRALLTWERNGMLTAKRTGSAGEQTSEEQADPQPWRWDCPRGPSPSRPHAIASKSPRMLLSTGQDSAGGRPLPSKSTRTSPQLFQISNLMCTTYSMCMQLGCM